MSDFACGIFSASMSLQIFFRELYRLMILLYGKNNNKFFAAVTSNQISGALRVLSQGPGNLPQAFITPDMAVSIVISLEAVHIYHHH